MLIKVRVFANSKKKEVIKKKENSFDIKIKSKPIMGQANKEAILALADYFNVAKSEIKLIKGFKQRNKIFEINCVDRVYTKNATRSDLVVKSIKI